MPNYGDPKYWENRYKNAKNSTFDWLEEYSTLKKIIDQLNLNKDTCKILNLGCGNAELEEKMYDDGYKNISNIDISETVIEMMKERNKDRKELTFSVMDVRDLKFENSTFDLAIDKSTIDALLCGDNAFVNVAKMIKEVQRVIKTGGYYMIISYGDPDSRILHLERKFLNFEVQTLRIEKDYEEETGYDKNHYIYLCKKLDGADDISDKFFQQELNNLILQEKLEEEKYNEEKNNEEKSNKENTEIIYNNNVVSSDFNKNDGNLNQILSVNNNGNIVMSSKGTNTNIIKNSTDYSNLIKGPELKENEI